MSQHHGHFDLLGTLGRGFRASDDHTVTSLGRLKIKETKCNRANIVQNSNSLSLNFQLQAAPCSALGHTILWGEIMIKDIYILETLVWRNCHENALDNLQRMFFLSSWYIGFWAVLLSPFHTGQIFQSLVCVWWGLIHISRQFKISATFTCWKVLNCTSHLKSSVHSISLHNQGCPGGK